MTAKEGTISVGGTGKDEGRGEGRVEMPDTVRKGEIEKGKGILRVVADCI